jgi:hypothetical protein
MVTRPRLGGKEPNDVYYRYLTGQYSEDMAGSTPTTLYTGRGGIVPISMPEIQSLTPKSSGGDYPGVVNAHFSPTSVLRIDFPHENGADL